MNWRAAGLDALRAQRRGVQVVEHDQVDAAVGALQVGAHVRLDRLRRKQRALGALDRDVDERERRDLLRLAVFEDLEVAGLEVGDELALRVEHARVDFDVVHFRAERDRRLLRRPARWRLAAAPAAPAPNEATRASAVNAEVRSRVERFVMSVDSHERLSERQASGRRPQL